MGNGQLLSLRQTPGARGRHRQASHPRRGGRKPSEGASRPAPWRAKSAPRTPQGSKPGPSSRAPTALPPPRPIPCWRRRMSSWCRTFWPTPGGDGLLLRVGPEPRELQLAKGGARRTPGAGDGWGLRLGPGGVLGVRHDHALGGLLLGHKASGGGPRTPRHVVVVAVGIAPCSLTRSIPQIMDEIHGERTLVTDKPSVGGHRTSELGGRYADSARPTRGRGWCADRLCR